MADDCVFCKIVSGVFKSTKVYEDANVLAFEDLHPVAPVHILIVPKKHIASLDAVTPGDAALLQACLLAAQKIARDKKLPAAGYRVLTNTGPNAGQTVFHLHFHLLAGERLHPM